MREQENDIRHHLYIRKKLSMETAESWVLRAEDPAYAAGKVEGRREAREEIIRCLFSKKFFSPSRLADLFEMDVDAVLQVVRQKKN